MLHFPFITRLTDLQLKHLSCQQAVGAASDHLSAPLRFSLLTDGSFTQNLPEADAAGTQTASLWREAMTPPQGRGCLGVKHHPFPCRSVLRGVSWSSWNRTNSPSSD